MSDTVRPLAITPCYVCELELTCASCGYTTQPPAEWADTGDVRKDVRIMWASEDLPRFCARCGGEFDPAEREAIADQLDPSAWWDGE